MKSHFRKKETYTYISMARPTSIPTYPPWNQQCAPGPLQGHFIWNNNHQFSWPMLVSDGFREFYPILRSQNDKLNWIDSWPVIPASNSFFLSHTFHGASFRVSSALGRIILSSGGKPTWSHFAENCWTSFQKKILALNGDVSTSSQKRTMLKDYCNSKFAGQKTKEEMVFFLHVCLKMRDWNWDNPSCIHHPWIGIIRFSCILW